MPEQRRGAAAAFEMGDPREWRRGQAALVAFGPRRPCPARRSTGLSGRAARWRRREIDVAPLRLLTTVLQRDEHGLRFFSTITTFATSRNVTIDELHIECCFPVDEATAALCRTLAVNEDSPGDGSA